MTVRALMQRTRLYLIVAELCKLYPEAGHAIGTRWEKTLEQVGDPAAEPAAAEPAAAEPASGDEDSDGEPAAAESAAVRQSSRLAATKFKPK